MVIEIEEAFKVPNQVPDMLNQICMTHRRLENLLITFTSQALRYFVKKIDKELHKLHMEAI